MNAMDENNARLWLACWPETKAQFHPLFYASQRWDVSFEDVYLAVYQ